jgi:hypothetical protein
MGSELADTGMKASRVIHPRYFGKWSIPREILSRTRKVLSSNSINGGV